MRWWAGLQSDLISAPSPQLGHSQTGVCLLFPSPRGGIHCGVAWPFWATCTLPSLWCWRSGVLAGVDWQGARGWEGTLSSLFLRRSASGGALRHQEGVRPAEGWIPRDTALGVCGVKASSLTGTGSLWDFNWGMGEGDGAGEHLCSLPSCALLSRAQQLSLPLSSSPPVLQADLLTYTFQMLSPAGCQNTLHLAPLFLQARLGGSALPAGCPSRQSV